MSKEKHQMPSVVKQAGNFVSAAIKHVKSGATNVSSEEQEKRLAICNGCEFINEAKNRCTACGCFLLTKTKWATSQCPKGYW